MARPTDFTLELADKICKRIADGESLLLICKDDDMPHRSTVHRWLLDSTKKEFCDKYELSVKLRAEKMFEELVDIADDGTNDYVTKESENGGEYVVADREHIQRSRLRVDTRKWYLSKVVPKLYGDKLDITSKDEKLPTPLFANIPSVENGVSIHNSNPQDSEPE